MAWEVLVINRLPLKSYTGKGLFQRPNSGAKFFVFNYCRTASKIDHNTLSDLTGINRAMLSRLESQDYTPSIPQLEKLGEVLDFEPISLFVNKSSGNTAETCSPLNIAVAGTGYVGLSIAVLLAQHNHVTAVDIIPEKVDLINNRKSPIQDDYIEKYLSEMDLDLTATLDGESAYKDANFVVIAAPTNYDSKKNYFDTSAVSMNPLWKVEQPSLVLK